MDDHVDNNVWGGQQKPEHGHLARVVASLAEQVMLGSGLHVVAYTGSEEVFRASLNEGTVGFRKIVVLGTDGRHGESLAQILEQIFPENRYEELLESLESEDVSLAASHARVISDSCGRDLRGHPSLQLVQIVSQAVVRASRVQPILLAMDNLGLGQLDIQLLIALARYPHIPVLVAFQVSHGASEQALVSIQRLKDLSGNRVVSLAEPGSLGAREPWLDLDDTDFQDVRKVALLAALMGRIPEPQAFKGALLELGIRSYEFVQEVLTRAGKLTNHPTWQWKNFSDVQALRDMLQSSKDCALIASAAVRATQTAANSHGASSSEVLRFADMCLLAGEPGRALEPLRRSALGFHGGDVDVCRGLMKRHEQLLVLAENDHDRVHQMYVMARTEATEGHHDAAKRVALELLERATTLQMPGLAANAERLLAIVAWETGRKVDAETMMHFAANAHVELQDLSHAGQDYLMLGWWADRGGRHDEAYSHYQTAVGYFEQAGDYGRVTEAMAHHAVSLIAQRAYDEAGALLDVAEQSATAFVSSVVFADMLNSRAEIARARADWESAHSYASQSFAWFQLIGHRFAHISRFNLGLIALGAHRFGDARAIFEDLLEVYPTAGLDSRLPLVEAGLAVASLAWRDDPVFDEHLFAVEMAVTMGFRHIDLSWILQQGLELVSSTGQAEAQERLAELIELHLQPR